MKNDHRNKFSNLSNWKKEAWKNQGFYGIRTRDLRDTVAMLYQLNYEATHWEKGQFIEFISSVRSEMMWSTYEVIHIFELRFFRLLLSNCLNWKIYCNDHSSLWSTTAVQIYVCGFIAQLVEHCTGIAVSRRSRVRIPLKPWFFRLLLPNCLNWKIYCDDHSSL